MQLVAVESWFQPSLCTFAWMKLNISRLCLSLNGHCYMMLRRVALEVVWEAPAVTVVQLQACPTQPCWHRCSVVWVAKVQQQAAAQVVLLAWVASRASCSS